MTPTRRGPRDLKEARTVRDRILDAALEILRESGVQHLTQVRVADQAGVRQSHLTYYFATRQDLLHAVVARGVEGTVGAVHSALGEHTDESALLERVASSVADLEHMRLFLAMIVESDSDPVLRAMLVEATRRFEATLAQAVGGTDAHPRARQLLIALWGLGLYAFVARPSPKNDPTRAFVAWVAGQDVRKSTGERHKRRPG